jgi:RimJ/RimL family protein N-acetyltransferase
MTGFPVPVIETERLVMRGWRHEDFEPWAAICADDEVMRSLGRSGGLTPGEAWGEMAFFAGHWALKGFGHWALEERSSGELVGRAGLLRPPEWPDLEVGWTIARARWGEGLAGEAGRAAVEWAREALGARHVISLIEAGNARSIRVAEKLGMTHEGENELRGHSLQIYGMDLKPAAAPPERPPV